MGDTKEARAFRGIILQWNIPLEIHGLEKYCQMTLAFLKEIISESNYGRDNMTIISLRTHGKYKSAMTNSTPVRGATCFDFG